MHTYESRILLGGGVGGDIGSPRGRTGKSEHNSVQTYSSTYTHVHNNPAPIYTTIEMHSHREPDVNSSYRENQRHEKLDEGVKRKEYKRIKKTLPCTRVLSALTYKICVVWERRRWQIVKWSCWEEGRGEAKKLETRKNLFSDAFSKETFTLEKECSSSKVHK